MRALQFIYLQQAPRGVLSILFTTVFSFISIFSAAQEFWWLKGDSASKQQPVYGQKGIPHSVNTPGARYHPVVWKDTLGNVWLFGGTGRCGAFSTGMLNDLWKYTPSTNEWAWIGGDSLSWQRGRNGIKGSPSDTVWPSSRQWSHGWADNKGNLWLFGGWGMHANDTFVNTQPRILNDLWKYNISAGHWTWIAGSKAGNLGGKYGTQGQASVNNYPGARNAAVVWTDSAGKFWMFGGYGLGKGFTFLNDTWRYDPDTGEWTWMHGSNQGNEEANYGTIGIGSPSTIPGGRYLFTGSADKKGNMWIFGGDGLAVSSPQNYHLNDLWKYNINTNQWTWIAGKNYQSGAGHYGAQGIPSDSYHPGARWSSGSWLDKQGNFWLFGGVEINKGPIADLWKFNPVTKQWTWVKGAYASHSKAIYPAYLQSSPAAQPGCRFGHVTWTDANGALWLFGGHNFGASTDGYWGDLWRFADKEEENPTTLSEANKFTEGLIYPVPCKGRFCLRSSAEFQPRQISALNMCGQLVFQRSLSDRELLVHEIDLGDVQPGYYLVEVITKEGIWHGRQLIQQ